MAKKETREPVEISFHYQKSGPFRSAHVDGVHGGVSPRGYIQSAFFSERRPIPRVEYFGIGEDGNLGEQNQDKRESINGFVREVEFLAIMDIDVARSYREWLDSKISELEKILAEKGGADHE